MKQTTGAGKRRAPFDPLADVISVVADFRFA
jgi:hypothetical protein